MTIWFDPEHPEQATEYRSEPKKITSTATVAYVLDPDLAIPDVIDRNLASKYGLKNKGVPISFKSKKGTIKARGVSKKEKTDALNYIIDEIAPFIDLLTAPGLASEDIVSGNMVFIKEEITSSEYLSLSTFSKQLYVNATDSLYDRFPVGSDYAGLIVPPAGRFGLLSGLAVKDETVKVRGFSSKIKKGTRRMLVRLLDSSLLEFYISGNGNGLSDSSIESFFNKIIIQEPVILKKFILASALTDELGRPAYKIDTAMGVLSGNESLSRTPNVEETIEEYYVDTPVELVENTVLNLPSDFPTTIFYASEGKPGESTNQAYLVLKAKYYSNTKKGIKYTTAYRAMNNLNSSKYFDNKGGYGGTEKDLLHPGVLETILDEYIEGKDRSDKIKKAIELLGAPPPATVFSSNEGKTREGKSLLAEYLPNYFGIDASGREESESATKAAQIVTSAVKGIGSKLTKLF